MKLFKCLALVLSISSFVPHDTFASSRSGDGGFATGSSYFEEARGHYDLTVAGQFRPRHQSIKDLDFLSQLSTLEKEGNLRITVQFKSTSAIDGIDLVVTASQGCAMELHLLLAMSEAFVDIFDTGSDLFKKVKYVRTDLEKARNYFAQAALFLKGAQYICNHVLKENEGSFHEENIMKDLRNTSYTPASEINARAETFVRDTKRYHGGSVGVADYISYYCDVYAILFMNQYHFFQAHLTSKEPKTKMMLNRKMEGALKDFEFSLTTTPLLELSKLKEIMEDAPETATASSKKKRRRNKKKSIAPVVSAATSESAPLSAPEEVVTVSLDLRTPQEEVKAPAPDFVSQEPEAQPSSSITVTTAMVAQEENEHTPVFQEDLHGKNKEETPVAQSSAQPQEAQTPSRLQRLNAILDEHDGGPKAGMKPRKFLRLCAALHEAGYFSGFAANRKEVHVKTDQSVSVMHIEKHSANRKSPGVSTNTAKKMQEIIDALRQTQDKK